MKKFIIAFIAFSLSIIGKTQTSTDSVRTLDQLANMTVYLFQSDSDTTGSGGTGTVVKHNGKFFLLTATHVAKIMKKTAKIVFTILDDKPGILDLLSLTRSLNWQHHPIADISIIQLFPPNDDVFNRLNTFSFNSSFILSEEVSLDRAFNAIYLGYPITDLDLKHFSPLSFNCFPASGLITLKRADTKTKCTFFFLSIPSMQGCSGTSVYISVQQAGAIYGPVKTTMVGVIHGTSSDNTGGKLTMATPAFYIWDLLKKVQ